VQHFIQFGSSENRATTFDALAYAAVNTDLAAVFGTDTEALARHYVFYGMAEGRSVGGAGSVPNPGAAIAAPSGNGNAGQSAPDAMVGETLSTYDGNEVLYGRVDFMMDMALDRVHSIDLFI
jgi:hypothetical protein